MCQAYDAEYRSICASENWASRNGFIAAYRGQPLTANPHPDPEWYTAKAWAHGWRCYQQGLLPHSVETEIRYRTPDAPDWGDMSAEEFRRTKVLPEKVKQVLYLEVAQFPS